MSSHEPWAQDLPAADTGVRGVAHATFRVTIVLEQAVERERETWRGCYWSLYSLALWTQIPYMDLLSSPVSVSTDPCWGNLAATLSGLLGKHVGA